MSSDLWQPKISRYVDAELSEQEARAMEAHLRECPSCATEALRQARLKHETRLAGRRYTPSPQFRRKVTEKIPGIIPTRVPAPWRWQWAPILAGTVAILLAAGVLLKWSSERSQEQAHSRQLLAELTDIHVANLAASNPVDVVSSDRHTVKPWFQGKVPFSFNLPELTGSPFALVGDRLTFLNHEPGAHLTYNLGAHHISVFIFREQPELARAFSTQPGPVDVLQFHLESWSAHELRYVVMGDVSAQAIHQLAAMLQKSES